MYGTHAVVGDERKKSFGAEAILGKADENAFYVAPPHKLDRLHRLAAAIEKERVSVRNALTPHPPFHQFGFRFGFVFKLHTMSVLSFLHHHCSATKKELQITRHRNIVLIF